MKTNYLIIFLISFNTMLRADNPALNYINRFYEISITESMRSGIPASIIMAQGILESGAGQSLLATSANAHFGIKCKSTWTGDTIWINDDDTDTSGVIVPSCFRKYNYPEDSYIDHTDFLVKNNRYKKLFDYSRTDYTSWANGLLECGYATNPTYANDLIGIIEKYELMRFDIPNQLIEEQTETIATNNESDNTPTMIIPPAVLLPDDYVPKYKSRNTNKQSNINGSSINTNGEFNFEISPNKVIVDH
jgi:Mannosyl-glycoprotein endo-beta-N-acetylglucosaminidase